MSTSGSEQETITVTDFEDWMRPQVAALFAAEYGGEAVDQERKLVQFYDHPCQRDRAIRLVALSGETVVGFQSLFYWPYRYGDTRYRSFQSGRSLVSIDHRGKGIFKKLLNHLDENRDQYDYDFLIGFPVEVSYGSFIRNGWENPLNLTWKVKLLHPLSTLSAREIGKMGPAFDGTPEEISTTIRAGIFDLAEDRSFLEWRAGFSAESKHSHFHYREGSEVIRFDCKPNRRGRVNELIIGGVRRTSDDPKLLSHAFGAIIKAAKENHAITLLSIAHNDQNLGDPLGDVLRRRGFLRIRRQIHFITKFSERNEDINDASRWMLFRSDVDTW